MVNSSPDSNSEVGVNPFLNESELQPAQSDNSETISGVHSSAKSTKVLKFLTFPMLRIFASCHGHWSWLFVHKTFEWVDLDLLHMEHNGLR